MSVLAFSANVFCMLVRNCSVLDPAGDQRVRLIDNDGCGIDKNLLITPDYTDLNGAFCCDDVSI